MTKAAAIKRVGFIGLGIMGKAMARNLMRAGFEVHGFSRTKSRCADIIAEGLVWEADVADLADAVEAVITMVGYPSDVEQLYFGPAGLIERARPGSLLIDMTTSEPSLARRIHAAAKARGSRALDAPVSGGDIGARNATLAIMVGGDEADYAAALPLFNAMGKTIARMGDAGAGQHTKMVNQIVIAGTISGVAEAMAYAAKAGLDPNAVLDVIGQGAAGGTQLNVLGRKMVKGDFAPGFYVQHFRKDMTIAREEAASLGLSLPVLEAARERFRQLEEDRGLGHAGTQALLRLYVEQGT